ncbi:hypothetical protein PMKS-002611 [Pichia membranifaciens]|uniref:ATP-dependent DNA helicase PIF1 n=1 Tax=Pichia membranifaciens TaxID=4926 RepID=A0A1Q2YI20_9ASCO|nr:hypothetical protein PMKS-002611 [Pichia membranifaciens]
MYRLRSIKVQLRYANRKVQYSSFIMLSNEETNNLFEASQHGDGLKKRAIETEEEESIGLYTPQRKAAKLKPTISSVSDTNFSSCSFDEVSQKLKSLFSLLGEKFHDQKDVFVSLTDVLSNSSQPPNAIKPIPPACIPISVAASSSRSDSLQLSSTAVKNVSQSALLSDNKENVPDRRVLLPTSSPMKLETPLNRNRQQRNFGTLHMATQDSQTSDNNDTRHVKPIILSPEQEVVMELARRGNNIFYTGSAGTGKSLLLKKLIKNLKEQHPPDAIGVTASTGLAAYNIGGMTINSFTGIGLGTGKPEEMVRNIKRNKKVRDRWDRLKVLIIDEISMIDGQLLDKLDAVAKRLRDASKPFGGLQVIFCGDFYQLPPVSKNSHSTFAFESKFWKANIHVQVVLKKVFRQEGDKQFLQMLQEVRDGEVSESTAKKFRTLSRPLLSNDNLIPTKLFPTRKEVDIANNNMLKGLKGGAISFTAIDGGALAHTQQGQKMLESFLAPKNVTLKAGAQVMMIKNLDETLVNGSLGTVVGFLNSDTYHSYTSLCQELDSAEQEDDSYGMMRLLEEPNDCLADSIFDFLGEVKTRIQEKIACESNETGERYKPALISGDNETSGNDIELTDASIQEIPQPMESEPSAYESSKISIEVNSLERKDVRLECIERKEELLKVLKQNENPGNLLPLVCFRLSNGSSRTILVEKETFNIEDDFHNPIVSRVQLPLMLAWALSIHKSQGQTLKFVSVDLKKIFENGQAYVALSRAEHRRGLQVLNFSPQKIRTDPRVKKFYANLKDAETALEHIDNPSGEKSFDSDIFNRPTGFQTQVKNLQELSASPERFAKFEKQSKGIAEMIQNLNKNKDKKKRITDFDENKASNKKDRLDLKKGQKSKVPADMLMSEDETDSFERLFEGRS